MLVKELIKNIEKWAPPGIAWDKDNIGLLIGDSESKVKNIMLSLEVSLKVVDDAIKKRCNLIITHHPLIFKPLKSISNSEANYEVIKKLIKNQINLYSAHTNLDFVKDGVSFQLAKKLGLNNIKFLKNLTSNQYKVVVFVPEEHIEKVANAMHQAGGGIIGEYSNCSFRLEGTGTFKGSVSSNPYIGIKDTLEFVKEVRLEMIVNSFDLNKVLQAMRNSHPYEEVAYDVYRLSNENVNFGIGAIGQLNKEMTTEEFLSFVKKSLSAKGLRYSVGKNDKIKNVAVCGGSGSELLDEAIKQGADAFITADVNYHKFQDALGNILLIDAGHYETEILIIDELENRILNFLNKKKIKVYKFNGSTNPINFFNN